MRRLARSPRTASTIALFLILGAWSSVGSAEGRIEQELLWDDGEPDGVMIWSYYGIAVRFQGPPWARYVTHLRVYVGNDGVPGAAPFDIMLHRADGPWPYQLGDVAFQFGTGDAYEEDAWVDLELAPPVDLSDDAAFPDRVFFVRVSWTGSRGPAVGLDMDPPHDLATLSYEDEGWEPLEDTDGMVRAVVADTLTAVGASTWGGIKVRYLPGR